MKELFGADSPLILGIRKLVDIIAVSILWIITTIPLITIGISTTAMYDAVYKDIWHSRELAIISYLHALKNNFKQSFIVGAVFAVLMVLMGADIWIFRKMLDNGHSAGNLWILFVIVMALIVCYFIWLCAGIARFDAPLRQIMQNSLALLLTHLPVSALLIADVAVFAVLCWLLPGGLFVLPAVAMLCACHLIDRVFRLYMTEEERQAEDEKNESWSLFRKKKKS